MSDLHRVSPDGADFFRRNRRTRLIVGTSVTLLLAVIYAFSAWTYSRSVGDGGWRAPEPAEGIAVVIAPRQMDAALEELATAVLVFPAPDLMDAEGQLLEDLEVSLAPTLGAGVFTYSAGQPTRVRTALLPAPGRVQNYPFDTFLTTVVASASSGNRAIPVRVTHRFDLPGWSWGSTEPANPTGERLTASLSRDGSTKAIALLILTLMAVLGSIAVLITSSTGQGWMKPEIGVASWMTAMLFALIPLRGFLPGAPPIGSWIDILVFFWVVAVIMLSVAAVASTILLRARDSHLGRLAKQD